MRLCIAGKSGGVGPGLPQLLGMARQPTIDPDAGLQMELQRKDVRPGLERLICIGRSRGEQGRTRRQVERVTAPVQHRLVYRHCAQRRGDALGGESDRREADLLHTPRINARAQRRRDQLCAQAMPSVGRPAAIRRSIRSSSRARKGRRSAS